eukprot:IDg18150t1
MPEDTIEFNHEIAVDLFLIPNKSILHIIDRGTLFYFAHFLDSKSAEYSWNVIVDAWTTVFRGFPNIIAHDQSTNFDSAFFQDVCYEFGLVTKRTPNSASQLLVVKPALATDAIACEDILSTSTLLPPDTGISRELEIVGLNMSTEHAPVF